MREKLLHPLNEVIDVFPQLISNPKSNGELNIYFDVIQKCTLESINHVQLAIDIYEAGDIEKLAHLMHDIFSPSATLLSYSDFILTDLRDNLSSEQSQVLQTIVYRTRHVRYQLCDILPSLKDLGF